MNTLQTGHSYVKTEKEPLLSPQKLNPFSALAIQRPVRMLKLQFKDQRAPAIWLADERFTIGQDNQNTLVLDEKQVSAFHAEIRREDNQFFVSDAGSLNGTYVNGDRITHRFQLRAGDSLSIGSVEFELLDPKKGSVERTAMPKIANQDWSIQAINGPVKSQTFPIKGSVTIGRSSSCDIHFKNDKLSRKHVEIISKVGHLEIRDLDSANGTKVNQEKIKTAKLKAGDLIHLSDVTFLVIGPKVGEVVEEEEDVTVFSAPTMMASPADQMAIQPSQVQPQRPKPSTPPRPTPAASANPQASRPVPPTQPQANVTNNSNVTSILLITVVTTVIIAAIGYFYL